MKTKDFLEIKARTRSYPQRFLSPIMDVFRGDCWILGYIRDQRAFPLYKKEDIEYAAWAANTVPDLIEEIESLQMEIARLKAPPGSVL